MNSAGEEELSLETVERQWFLWRFSRYFASSVSTRCDWLTVKLAVWLPDWQTARLTDSLMNCSCHSENFEILFRLWPQISKQLEPPSPLIVGAVNCRRLQASSAAAAAAGAGLQSSRLKQFGFVLCKRKYCHWNGPTWRCSVAIPLAHKSTQVPTPQLIYFCPGKSSDSPSPASLPASYGGSSNGSRSRSRGKHLPKIFNRHLCTTIPVAIRCRLASPCLLFLLYLCVCVWLCVCMYI